MFRFLVIAMFIALTSAFMAPVAPRSMLSMSKVSMQVDEATREQLSASVSLCALWHS